jgi:fatty acid desaturase
MSGQVLLLLIVPGLVGVHAAWGWLLVMPLLLNNTLWASIHEAIHGALLPDRHRNERLGRTLAILHGAPFALLRMGHLLHHRYSRTERERTEVYDDSRTTWLRAAGGYYAHLFGGLYLAEVAGGLILLLPRRLLAELASRLDRPDNVLGPLLADLMRPEVLSQARLDAACILALYGLSFLLYGDHGWMLLLALLARAFTISFTDNVYHYGTPLDERRYAVNLRLPETLSKMLLRFNLHGVHHRYPNLPWWKLAESARLDRATFAADMGPALLGQLTGPIPASAFPE